MENKLVSIIIPIYNTEKYLSSSIDSVISQDYPKKEIILVNDGSPDNAHLICESYSAKYDYIKVINKENGGLSDARNFGIQNAIGEYIIFLDSDDMLVEGVISKMVNEIESSNSDIIIPNKYYEFSEENKHYKKKNHFKTNKKNMDSRNFLQKVLMEKGRAWRATAVLYKKIIISDNLRFKVGLVAEDIFFNIQYLLKIKKVRIVNYCTLYNLKRIGSITSTFQDKFGVIFLALDEFIKKQFEISKIKSSNLTYAKNQLLCRNTIMYLSDIFSKKNNWEDDKKECISIQYLNEKQVISAFSKTRTINPYFNNAIKTLYFKIVFLLIKKKRIKFAIKIIKLVGNFR